jgi:hypothetical protein
MAQDNLQQPYYLKGVEFSNPDAIKSVSAWLVLLRDHK